MRDYLKLQDDSTCESDGDEGNIEKDIASSYRMEQEIRVEVVTIASTHVQTVITDLNEDPIYPLAHDTENTTHRCFSIDTRNSVLIK